MTPDTHLLHGPWRATHPSGRPRVLLADRGDPLVASMSVAMRERFDVVQQLDTDLTPAERVLVAATTVRPGRRAWAERFFKSNLGVAIRSRRARAGLAGTAGSADVVFQTHALFDTSDDRTVMYLDCTHRQSMQQWPAWNPLRGRALDRWLRRELHQYQAAAHLFAFAEETARSLVEEYGVARERVSVVGAGLNFDHLPRLPEVAAARSGPPTVLFVGNDFERKGGHALLAAFAELRRRVPEARLRIVGTPYAVPAQDGVERLGRVHGRDHMSQLYAEADVFCLPSYFDPFPGALLEAMAHGLPCVVTRTCGVPEMVVDGVTALTVGRDEQMVDELATALERLLVDQDAAARMGLRGRRRVEERFLWSHVVDRMAPVIERLAETQPPTAPAHGRTPPAGTHATAHRSPSSTSTSSTSTMPSHVTN